MSHQTIKKIETMKVSDLKKGSIVEIRLNLSPKLINQPVQVQIERTSDKFLWFKHNSLQRMGRTTFETCINHFNYKIISI